LWSSTFSNQFSEVALLEHHRVIVPTLTIPHQTNNTNSCPWWWLWQNLSVVRKCDCSITRATFEVWLSFVPDWARSVPTST
jgi:hypothetical protein